MGVWAELLGPYLRTKQGASATDEVLAGKKVVGLYFSAHWCPPCRAFTPFLGATYDDMVEEHPEFELVFISSDQNAAAFDEYYGEMPFLAVPFENRMANQALSMKYQVRGIPTLVFLNEKGELITTDGRMWAAQAQGNVDQLWNQLTK